MCDVTAEEEGACTRFSRMKSEEIGPEFTWSRGEESICMAEEWDGVGYSWWCARFAGFIPCGGVI